MRNKSVILLAIALGCGMIASVGISQVVMQGGSTEAETEEILVATQDIPANAKITAENIMLEKWPAGKTPTGVITDISALEDKYAKQHLYAGEPILTQKIVDATERASVGIPQGHTVVTYNIGNDPGIANLIEPGDRVNVIGFFEKSDVVPETTHKDVFRNVLIFAVDGRTTRDTEDKIKETPKTVLLLIKQEDERVWNWANKKGSIELTLGNPNEAVDPDSPDPAGQAFMKWIDDYAKEQAARTQVAAPAAVEQAAPVDQGGETIKVLTPTGYRLYRWNERTQTMELIESQLPTDTQLGSGNAKPAADNVPIGIPQDKASADVDPDHGDAPAFRLNRSR